MKDDDLAEIDTTLEEARAMIGRARPVAIDQGPAGVGIRPEPQSETVFVSSRINEPVNVSQLEQSQIA